MKFLPVWLVLGVVLAWGAARAQDAVLAPKWSPAQFSGIEAIESQVLKLTNEERKKQGLKPVTVHTPLQTAARQHSREMGEERYFAHESPDARWKMPWQRAYNAGYWGQAVGENIVSVEDDSLTTARAIAERLIKLWMGSPPHRANILNPRWTLLGVGVVKVRDTFYGTQLFAAPLFTLENAGVSRVTGEMVTLKVEGSLGAGVINVWANEQFLQSVTPSRGAFTVAVPYPRKSGKYTIMIGVGERVAWKGTLDTDAAAAKDMLDDTRTYRAGVVTHTTVDIAPFSGLRLTGTLRLTDDQATAYLIRDDAILDKLTANDKGLISFDTILLKRDAYYTIGFGVGSLREDVLFINAAGKPDAAFLGRPE
jgi:uncharacterized protein YkwD